MQYFKTTIRLDGSTSNEVQKVISAPELLIMQFIHGSDAVTKVELVKEEQINVRKEKERLKGLYDQALVKRKQSVDTIFGPLGSVVERLPEDMLQSYNIFDEDDVVSIAKNATKTDKSSRIPQNITEANRIDHIVSPDEVSLDEIVG